MIRKASKVGAAAALATMLAAAGCSPVTQTHGFVPRAAELDAIEAGVDTRATVLRKVGRPTLTSTFDTDEWFYISTKTETFAFYEPEVVEQTIITIAFDDQGAVTEINRYGVDDGRVIDLVTRETPTSGRKLTILQQAFGNIGRFNADSIGN